MMMMIYINKVILLVFRHIGVIILDNTGDDDMNTIIHLHILVQ